MRAAALITVAFAPLALAFIPPFVKIVRGGSPVRAFWTCWGLLFFWISFFALGIPLLVMSLTKNWSHSVWNWTPEPAGVVGIVLVGWMPAGAMTVIAMLVRKIVVRMGMRKRAGAIDDIVTKDGDGLH